MARAFASLSAFSRLGRLDKPIGTYLTLLPCTYSLALTAPTYIPDPIAMGVFTAGAFFTRSAGCTANDWWDINFDK
jgi:4-hydroxybenzoate polyprenyltransferase